MKQVPPDFVRDYLPLPLGPKGPGCASAIIQGGSVVTQHCTGMASVEHQVPITPKTVFRVASITKQFLCAALVALADEGKLDLDAPLGDFVTLKPSPARTKLRHAMSNTSGIRDHLELWFIAGGGLLVPHRLSASLALCARQEETNFPAGTRYLYSNANFLLLSQVAETVTGKPLADYLEERFFAPLGMTRTRLRGGHCDVVPDLATGYVVSQDGELKRGRIATELWGEGAAHSCLEDLIKWVGYYRDDPERIIARMRQPMPIGTGTAPYGLGLFTETWCEKPSLVHTGLWPGYLTELLYFFEEDLAVVTLTNVNSIEPTAVNRKLVRGLFRERVPTEAEDWDKESWHAAVEAGLWINPETLDVAEFLETKDKHKLLSTYGFSTRMHPVSGRRLEPEFRRSDYAGFDFSHALTGSIDLQLVNGSTVPLVPAHSLGQDEALDWFPGTWWCDEIEAKLIILRADESFKVETPGFRGFDWVTSILPGGLLQIEDCTGPWPLKFFLLLEDGGKNLILNGPRVRRLTYKKQYPIPDQKPKRV